MKKFAIALELIAVGMLSAEACFLAGDMDFHFVGYIGASFAVFGSCIWAKMR